VLHNSPLPGPATCLIQPPTTHLTQDYEGTAMLTLTDDQRGLIDYLADKVHELTASATGTTGVEATDLMREAQELTAIRGSIIDRAHAAENAAQLQLPLELRKAA